MKKKYLLLALSVLLMSCNDCNKCTPCTVIVNSENATANSNLNRSTLPSICIDLVEYEKEVTVENKAEWLRKYGKSVCEETLFDAIEVSHLIKPGSTISFSNSNRSFSKSWEKIKDFIGDTRYNAYIGFNQDFSDLILKPRFDPRITSFSAPLFHHLKKKYNLQDHESILFIKDANVDGVLKDIIKIVKPGFDDAYYDYSDEPKLINDSNPL